MHPYSAPLTEIRFALEVFAGSADLARLPGRQDATPDVINAVLEEAGRLAGEVFSPLNQLGDQQPSQLENGVVRTPKGFAEAYQQFVAGGWNALALPAEAGGQSLPTALALATTEMWNAANMSLALCPLLNAGALELLWHHGSEVQKTLYLPKMASGEWTGTMNLTEPQAGTDLGALKTRAVPDGQGNYRITGQKIFITWGEHDMTANTLHMVLARLPDAPPGSKGISLFLVPKYLLDAQGNPGQRNDLRCVALEHKLGIKASPTCVMAYGDNGGALGTLIGEPHRGLEYMFTMMNNERLGVGLQSLGLAERAYQNALAYARSRKQSRALNSPSLEPVAIIEHPDVRRNLLTQRALVEAARALAYAVGGALDRQTLAPEEAVRRQAQAQVEVLIPIVKAWISDIACHVTSLNVQVHGGAGFIESSGAPQLYRDARILPIYEGTNGVQALDLLLRKILRDNGVALGEVERWLDHLVRQAEQSPDAAVQGLAPRMTRALDRLHQVSQWLLRNSKRDPLTGAAVATPFLSLFGLVAGGCLLTAGAAAAAQGLKQADTDHAFLRGKLATARFYLDNILPQVETEAFRVLEGAASILAVTPGDFL